MKRIKDVVTTVAMPVATGVCVGVWMVGVVSLLIVTFQCSIPT